MPEDEIEQISAEEKEWREWLGHPCTKRLRTWAAREFQAMQDKWASGAFTDMGQFGTAILNAKAIGSCEILSDIKDLDFQQIGDIGGE